MLDNTVRKEIEEEIGKAVTKLSDDNIVKLYKLIASLADTEDKRN